MKNAAKLLIIALLSLTLGVVLINCGSSGGDSGSDASLLVGTWDMTEATDDTGGTGDVPSGTVTVVITETTYTTTDTSVDPECIETGDYTADATTITSTVTSVVGSACDSKVGDTGEMQYTVDSTTLTTTDTDDGDISIFQRKD